MMRCYSGETSGEAENKISGGPVEVRIGQITIR
jgi:hypothetical protein